MAAFRPDPASTASPIHAMSVDVEDYLHAWALAPAIPRERWDSWPSRVVASTRRVLALLAAAEVHATFFVLGWVARRHPGLVRDIVAGGHELASHGHGHHKVGELGPRAFRRDVADTRLLLEDAGGVPVRGYRAPSFSIGPDEWWAFEALGEAGYGYSSSVHPDRPRPLRPARGTARPVPAVRRGAARDTGGHARSRSPCLLRRRRAFSRPALRLVALVPRPLRPCQPEPRHLLLPPVGDRPRPATGARACPGVRGFATTSISGGWRPSSRACCADFAWDRIDRVHDLTPAHHPSWRPTPR